MALDKLVDSTQLDASLTYEAGKLRAKLGSSAQLDFDLANEKGFGDYIDAIPSSVVNVASATLASEVNWYVAYSALNFKLKYKKSAVLVVAFSDSAATGGGSFTNNNYHIRHNGQTVISVNAGKWYFQQKSSKVAPSSTVFNLAPAGGGTWYTAEVATISADGVISPPVIEPTSSAIPAGALVVALEIPYTNANGEFDLTLFGE